VGILDGYGDDSIGELGGAHLAVENISMLAAKAIEDCRIGGSPLEKSTRYIYFDQKVDGEYLFYREPILMASAYRDIYLSTCNHLYETYSKLIPRMTEVMEKKFPKEPEISKVAYTAALRARVLDSLRGLLPASALTNMGVFGNGRFFESLIQKLNCHTLAEFQDIGRKTYQELNKVIPSFIRRGEQNHKYQKSFTQFMESTHKSLKEIIEKNSIRSLKKKEAGVWLIESDKDAPFKIAASLLFGYSEASLEELEQYCQQCSVEKLNEILEAASAFRESRRHKSPRALERAFFTFEIVADFGVYRDLQRHRMLTQDRHQLSCSLGYFIPQEVIDTDMEVEYRSALDRAKRAYDEISQELPEEAQYIVPMAYNLHWYFHLNVRALQWLCELRSAPAGHPTYRFIAQEMTKQICQSVPQLERFFKFVDFEGYELGRLGQEIRIAERFQEKK